MGETDVDSDIALRRTIESTADFYLEVGGDLNEVVHDIIAEAAVFFMNNAKLRDEEEAFDELAIIIKSALKVAVEETVDG